MTAVGPLKFKRLPEPVRRQLDVAAATAWEALVEAHTAHALRFVALMAAHLDFDEALDRFTDAMDLREPMASAVNARVLIALEDAERPVEGRPILNAYPKPTPEDLTKDEPPVEGLKRFRLDILMKGLARRARASEAVEELTRLAIARAEEGVIRAHIDNAVVFTTIVEDELDLGEAVEDYIELMRISGGRAQAVYQRAMARLADLHLPSRDENNPRPG